MSIKNRRVLKSSVTFYKYRILIGVSYVKFCFVNVSKLCTIFHRWQCLYLRPEGVRLFQAVRRVKDPFL